MQAKVYVTLKKGVHDPQGEAVGHTLSEMGYKKVGGVRIGKYIEIRLNDVSPPEAETMLKEMCDKLLANTVIESYKIDLQD
ncbi:MAG: phosphoribosylformylglycinamidine synthase [Deltaproteobacteria bacterium CG07_land_8_20_14_0_80_38_7]|nr:MAG: phosphoribosylformylglycinamidine synthase [Deltaproteobacteria bacterium CG07_land_8_20_14_0_80_38_7]